MTRNERSAAIDNLQHTPGKQDAVAYAIKALWEELTELRDFQQQISRVLMSRQDDGK